MNVKSHLYVVLLTLTVHSCLAGKLPPKKQSHSEHHNHGSGKHPPVPPQAGRDDDDDDYDDEDDFPDNEVANERTISPPGSPSDPWIDDETNDVLFADKPPPLVDFIVIRHRFSNVTNQAYPSFVHTQKLHKGKKRSGIKSKNFERRPKNGNGRTKKRLLKRRDR